MTAERTQKTFNRVNDNRIKKRKDGEGEARPASGELGLLTEMSQAKTFGTDQNRDKHRSSKMLFADCTTTPRLLATKSPLEYPISN